MKTKIMCLIILLKMSMVSSFANTISIKFSNKIAKADQVLLAQIFDEISSKLPNTFIDNLPQNLEINIEQLSNHSLIPTDICESKVQNQNERFVYGEYSKNFNKLILNTAVFNELKKGEKSSVKINCQHKNMYNQAIATIIHELGHAYDSQNKLPSSQIEFYRLAGYKKGILTFKNKNVGALRSEDPYELINVQESFAVNLEYFFMDEEFYCRRPSLFDYYKKKFNYEPFQNRNCELNTSVLMSTNQGFTPIKLDPKRIYRIDYLLASPGSDLSSGFGHAMFRLIVCAPKRYDFISKKSIEATPFGEKCLDDKLYHVIVSYRANVEDATLNYFKGIFGGYPSVLFILNFSDVLDEYNKDELRDIISFPLQLSEDEKDSFVKKVIEEHWNYRGKYKFFTNNCAVESADLLKASINHKDFYNEFAVTPNGLLKDLEQMSLLNKKNRFIERYKAKTEQLIESYKVAYGYLIQNSKVDKKNVKNFIENSDPSSRNANYLEFTSFESEKSDNHNMLFDLKNRLIKSSSFAILEQQILRTKTSIFRKKAADLYFNTKDKKIKNKLDEFAKSMKNNIEDFAPVGYGIPLNVEINHEELGKKQSQMNNDNYKEIELLLKSLMPKEFEELDQINKNLSLMNEISIKFRKKYRTYLEQYIITVIQNMKTSTETLSILNNIKNGDTQSLINLRKILDENLVSEKEILDNKLRNIVINELQ